MHLRKILVLTLLVLSISTNLFSQLTVISPDTVVVTNYAGDFPQDSMYVFYGPGQNGWPLEMKAKGMDVDTLPSTFTWARLDASIDGYWEVLKTETNVDSSEFSTAQSAVYSLRVENNQNDTTCYFVLVSDDMKANLFYRPDCDELKIQGVLTTDKIRYLNRYIIPPAETEFINTIRYDWRLEYLDAVLDTWIPDTIQRTFNPEASPRINPIPREEEFYRVVVNVHDTLGHYVWDTLVYQSISVEADFVASIGGEDRPESEPNIKGQAPFRVQFKNLSKNAIAYEWSFWNRTESLMNRTDTVWKTMYNFEPLDSLEYIDAGSYTVKLKASGRAFFVGGVETVCTSVDSILNYITVYNSAIGKLPNVISPSDDPEKYFNFMKGGESESESEGVRSIKRLEVYIYSRGGDKVYEYSGDDDDWDGWNGYRMGHGMKVQPGVYFYVILAQGWDGMQHKARGFVHVYH